MVFLLWVCELVSGSFHLVLCCHDWSMLRPVSPLGSFSWLNNIPSCGCTTSCLSIYLMIDSGLFPPLVFWECFCCVIFGVPVFNRLGPMVITHIFLTFFGLKYLQNRPPYIWKQYHRMHDTLLDVPGSHSECKWLQIAIIWHRCTKDIWTFLSSVSCCSCPLLCCFCLRVNVKRRLWN